MTDMPGDSSRVGSVTAVADRATRPLVTLMLVGVFCYGFIIDKISGETFGNIVISVTAFWFAQRGQETRASDRLPDLPPGATATAPPSGGTATATVTPSHKKEETI